MEWRAHVTSIGLTIAAAGALVYAYADRGSVTESEKKTRAGSVFVAWRREELAKITLDRGAEHLVLERIQDDAGEAEWWMRAPLAERAESAACDSLASTFEFASVVRKVAADVQAPGFDAPRARGEIRMGAVTYRFELGGDAPTPAGAAYLRLDGTGIVVVSREVVTALVQSSDTFRSRSFVPYVSVNLAGLEVKGETDLRIERGDDVSFKLVPSGLRASRGRLDAIWGAFAEMRAEAFVSDAVAEPLVAHPAVTITMTPRLGAPNAPSSSTPGVIRVGGACPDNPDDVVVVRDSPTRLSACAPKGILEGLATKPESLLDAQLFAAHADEVAEVRIESLAPGAAASALELARKESGWREKSPAGRDLPDEEAAAATALVAAIAGAEGTDPRKGGESEPFEAKWRVTIRRVAGGLGDGGIAEVVEVGEPDAAGDAIVRRAFDGARIHLGSATVRKLTPRTVALRGPEVWEPRIEGMPVQAIETKCAAVDQTVTREGDRWALQAPTGFAADNGSVLEAIDAVTRARAESWVADADDGRFGFAASPCFVSLTLRADGGARVVRIELGREGEGGVYARTTDGPNVFVAPLGLRDRARSWLIDLHALSLPTVQEVALVRGGKRLAFVPDGGTEEPADAVLTAANVLRADSVVHLGGPRGDEGFTSPSLVVTLEGEDAAGTGTKLTKRVVFGAETADRKARFARVDGVDATYTVDSGRVRAFFDRF